MKRTVRLTSPTSSLKIEDARLDGVEILTPKETANILRVSGRTITRLCAAGKIPFKKIGGQTRFVKSEIVRWLKGEFE